MPFGIHEFIMYLRDIITLIRKKRYNTKKKEQDFVLGFVLEFK